jgi:DUF4097 and DUF4098 domain-containing protein YvlB
MRLILSGSLALAVWASPANAQNDQCKHSADRSANLDASSVRLLELSAGAGSLKIEGKAGLDRVIIRARACASEADLVDEMRLEAKREGSAIVVRANIHENDWMKRKWRNNMYARLDVVVEVPAGMAAEIEDGSGEMDLSNLGAVRIKDGSGGIAANDLASARIEDGSGEIRLVDIRGAVDIEDGSGEIELANIDGLIEIEDGSGEITVRTAKNHVRISDQSGSISVRDVAGDFIVQDDGSGSIDYDNVRGRVDVPRNKR